MACSKSALPPKSSEFVSKLTRAIDMRLLALDLRFYALLLRGIFAWINRNQHLLSALLIGGLGLVGTLYASQASATIYRCGNDASVITLTN